MSREEPFADNNANKDMNEAKKIALLFPGQGSQVVGMGKDLAALYPVAHETFDEADAALGYKLSQLCFEGPEAQLRLTEITQPAILTASVAAFRVLESATLATFVAGHSLGEYSAHVAAGTSHLPTPCAPSAIAASTCRKPCPSASAPWLPYSRWRSIRFAGLRRVGPGRGLPRCQHQLSRPDRHLRQQGRGRARRRAGQATRRQARHNAARQRTIPLCADAAGAGSTRS